MYKEVKGDIIMAKIATKTTVINEETGEIIRETFNRGSQNGDGWVLIYREAYRNLLLKVTNPSILRVFGLLITKQEFERGIHATKKAIAEELNISYDSVMVAFKWLKENNYIKEHKVDGVIEFLLNPDVTTCGKNKKKKLELWNSI